MKSVTAGETPQWFTNTYKNADGTWKLEEIWAAVKCLDDSSSKTNTVYQFRDSFGGYCSLRKAHDSAYGRNSITNPWRDGGSPKSPTVIGVAPRARQFTVSWSAPASIRGHPSTAAGRKNLKSGRIGFP